MFRFYTGTFTNWFEDGETQPFAVENADEIPASCKDIRTQYANSADDAIFDRFGVAEYYYPNTDPVTGKVTP